MSGINWMYKETKNSKWVEKILHHHIKEEKAATASLDASS
jgi:hypothetical protein